MIATLPTTWTSAKLSDICQINPRGKSGLADDDEVTFVPMAAVSEFSGTIVSPETRPLREVQKGFTPFQEGDVLFAKITPCMENGKAVIARNLVNQRGYGSTEFHVMRPTPLVIAEWIFAIIRTKEFRRAAASSFQGAVGQQRVTASFLESFRIPLPPLSEQQRIVEILQEAEGIRRLRAEAEAKTAELGSATFFHFFGDESKQHKSLPLRELVEEFRYGTSQPSGERGATTLRIPNVLGDRISFEDLVRVEENDAALERLRLQTGDMLFVRTNGNPDYVGRCGVFDVEDASLNIGDNSPVIYASYLIRARLKSEIMRPWFLHAYLKSPIGRARILKQARTAAGQYNINTEGLGAIKVPVPSLALQDRFLLEALENRQITEKIRLSERNMTAFEESLSAHAFSGRLTADWRDTNSEQIAYEASERDQALYSTRKQIVSYATSPEYRGIVEVIFKDRTDGIYSDLNSEQRFLLREVNRMFAGVDYGRYFTAEKIADEIEGPLHRNPQGVLAHLQVFAVRGLLIPVSRRRKDATGSPFAGCYRLPLKASGGRTFSGVEDIELPEQPGDDVRGELMKIQRRLATGTI
jgi:Restriction endonuclease S subunits